MKKLLALDIGGGTQDILLYDPEKTMENCIQLILPSPTQIVARQIAAATVAGRPLFLYGSVMGGGASTRAIMGHLAAGLPVVATPQAALTVHDNLERVSRMGITIAKEAPTNAVPVRLGDIDKAVLGRILGEVHEELPEQWAVAVQDHGFSPVSSNREFRFRLWEQFMSRGGKLVDLAFWDAPRVYTRMRAVQEEKPGALLMDTCGAALLGALTDKYVQEAAEQPVAVINLGNQHTFAAVVDGERIVGLFEHHTGLLDAKKTLAYLERLLAGRLTNAEIQKDGGHGCVPPAVPLKAGLVAVTGPRRALLAGTGLYFPAPHGNMMLLGCFGLVEAFRKKTAEKLKR